MYNLARLLTEEPKKLERLIILFFKLLITICFATTLFGYKIELSTFIDTPIPKNITAADVIYFLLLSTLIWFVLWFIILENIFYELPIWLLTRKNDFKNSFLFYLDFFSILNVNKNNKITGADTNIISFYRFLNQFDKSEDNKETLRDIRERLKQYYLIVVPAFCFLLFEYDLKSWEIIIGTYFIINFFIGNTIICRAHKYIDSNLEAIKREIGPLAFAKQITETMNEIQLFSNYETPKVYKKMVIKRISGYEALPSELMIVSAFHWNHSLGKRMINSLVERGQLPTKMRDGRYTLFITNIPLDTETINRLNKSEWFSILMAGTEEEMFFQLEEWIHFVIEENKNKTKSSSDIE